MNASQLIAELLDFVFVPRCLACGDMLHRPPNTKGAAHSFCMVCKEALLPLTSPSCPCCREPFTVGNGDHLCSMCLSSPPSFQRIDTLYEYGGPLATAILKFKYAPAPHLAKSLSELLHQASCEGMDYIIPVPLHPKRLTQRGFNQAALLAKALAKQQGKRVLFDVLHRVLHMNTQVGKNRKERIHGMKGAFAVRDSKALLANKHVLLVDDVVTTTATVRAAARCLKREGNVASVRIVCIGRSSNIT